MKRDNIKLWFARNSEGGITTISEINDSNRHNTYSCPICGSNLIPKATKSIKVSSYFSHFDLSKCNSESMIHWWFKNKFLEKGDNFTIITDTSTQYTCDEVQIEAPYDCESGIYRPDVTVTTTCGSKIFFEMNYSNNKKTADYINIWLELNTTVVEVDIKKLILGGKTPSFKALFFHGKCFNTKKNDLYYNTIGKYKEEVYVDEVTTEHKERLKRLDWFWSDMSKYKNNEIDIEQITRSIDSVEDYDDREIINNILSKNSCVQIFEDYIKYKANTTLKEALSRLRNSGFYEEFEVHMLDVVKTSNEKHIVKFTVGNKFEQPINVFDHSLDDLVDEIKKSVEWLIVNRKREDNLTLARENVFLINAILNLDQKYKNRGYHIYNRFSFDAFVTMSFQSNTVVDIDLRDCNQIVKSNNIKFIEDYLEKEINKYLLNVTPFVNEDMIIDTIKCVHSSYSKLKIKEKYILSEKISKRRYKETTVFKERYFQITHRKKAEDLIYIGIEKCDSNRLWTGLCIYKDKLYYNEKEHRLITFINHLSNANSYSSEEHIEESKNTTVIIGDFSNNKWSELERTLIRVIGQIIGEQIKERCVTCKNNNLVSSGEVIFFAKNGFTLPLKCKECRSKPKKIGGVTIE